MLSRYRITGGRIKGVLTTGISGVILDQEIWIAEGTSHIKIWVETF